MKFSRVVLVLVLVLVAVAMVSGRRGKNKNKADRMADRMAARKAERKAKMMMKKNCHYNRRDAVCDNTLTPPKKVLQLIPEESIEPENCPASKSEPCDKRRMVCHYDKNAPCQENGPSEAPLRELISDSGCALSKPNRKCQKEGRTGCRYNMKERFTAECNTATQMVTISLKKGGAECEQTKQVACPRKSSKGTNRGGSRCRYNWKLSAECDPVTNMKQIPLKKGGADCEKFRSVDCDKMGPGGRGGRDTACKYQKGTWSDCDPDTNMKTMVKTLKRGDPATCNKTMTEEKLCKRKPIGIPSECQTVWVQIWPNFLSGLIWDQTACDGYQQTTLDLVCKYRRTQWSDCDPVSNKKTMVKFLKSGKASVCQPTQTLEKMCKGKKKGKNKVPCKYKKNKWGKCNPHTNTVSRLLMLKKGDIGVCQATKIISRPCRKNRKKGSGSRRRRKGCKYDKSQWGPCDAATNTVTRLLTLKAGDPSICNATTTDVRRCKDKHLRPHVCKYKRTAWGLCDKITNTKVMVKTLKRGDPAHCEATETVERKCKGNTKTQATSRVCKYKFEDWSECDIATNTMTRKQTLKSGPSSCQQVKEYSRKCKAPCKFINGDWSACNPETNQMTRTDTVTSGSADFCGTTRVLTKKCNKKGKKKCKYDYGEWGDCDIETNKRTRIRTLISVDEVDCQPEKSVSKTCTKSNGEARCFFGPWQEYDECQNGVQKKKRDVIQGGLECERKGVKMKSC